MTANLYLPKSPGRHPAILAVHGHWRGAKQDPVVQARCIGAAKLGFVVLAVDAFGAGERAVGKALGEYHGEMTAATLLPTGQTLAGLQVYENTRAVDYLATRPEVDAARIGITGASGGGNQTMYAGAMIDGFKAAVPVCSVGNYRSYLGTACCMCEVVPGALTFTEEWGVLGLAAPRPLMVVNATRDAIQFSVAEAKKTIAGLEPVFSLFGKPAEPASRHLRVGPRLQQGDARGDVRLDRPCHLEGRGRRLPDRRAGVQDRGPRSPPLLPRRHPPRRLRDPAEVCRGRGAEAGRREGRTGPTPTSWKAEAERRRAALVTTLGGFPDAPPVSPRAEADGGARVVRFEPEPGLRLAARVEPGKEAERAPGRPARPRRGRGGVREPAGRRATQGRLVAS